MRSRLALAAALLVLAAAAAPAAAATQTPAANRVAGPASPAPGAFSPVRPLAVTQSTTYTFGVQPLADVLASAGAQTKCAGLTQNELAAMMLAPTYPETGASGTLSPSPMTLSRYDTVGVNPSNANLYFQDNPSTPYSRAFWNPGVGAWQFDSAGLWNLSTAQEISTDSASAAAAATMATAWCAASGTDAARRAVAWKPWAGCAGGGACETIYQAVYDPTTLKVSTDAAVTRGGGMVTRSCTVAGIGTVTCSRIDPSLAQGDAAFAVPGFGPTPISAPFYDYVSSGTEHRVWLSSDTGYPVSISASKPVTANARTSLTWSTAPGLCDLTTLAGACSWSGWQPFDSVWSSRPSVVANADGRLEIFATGFDGVVYHAWQATPNGIWSGWAQLPGLTTARSLVATLGTGGHVVVVVQTSSGSASTASYSGTAWSSWSTIGGSITASLSAATNRDGRAEFFAISTAGAVVHQWQTSFGTWSGWVSLGGPVGPTSLTAVTNLDGRLEVFLVGGLSTVYHAWQSTAGGPFVPWRQLGGNVSGGVSIGFNVGGRLEVFYRGINGALWHLWQTAVNGGWSAPASLGGSLTGTPTVAANRDGRLEVFAVRTGGVPWHIWQVAAGGTWSAWQTFGGPAAAALAVAPQADGHLVLFELTTGSVIYRNLQLA